MPWVTAADLQHTQFILMFHLLLSSATLRQPPSHSRSVIGARADKTL